MPRSSINTTPPGAPVVIEAALNGGRTRSELSAVPRTPTEVAEEARRAAVAGAQVVHIHALEGDAWSASPGWYGETIRRIRNFAPDVLVSITSIRPSGTPVEVVLDLLAVLGGDPATRPDLISVNLGHLIAWEADLAMDGRGGPRPRRTRHFPNDVEDIAAVLAACKQSGVRPELGVMDLGFISNAVALHNDGLLPERPWFLLELDSPGYGAGRQVAPATVEDYDILAARLRRYFPASAFAAHGADLPTFAVVRRALEDGAHVRVGFEDAVVLPDGRPATTNAEAVAWAVAAAHDTGREVASIEQSRRIIGLPSRR